MKSVIIYSSTDGQTRKICEFIKENLLNKSEHKLLSIENTAEFNLNNFDCIIIGASIRYGKHSAKVFDFIKNNIELIKVKKRFIMFITRGPTDTSQTYEFTNWEKVKKFAIEINESFS